MPKTEVRSAQILNATVGRSDINTATPGEAIVAKIVAGTGITISSTGADTGTGDVTITSTASGTGDVVGPGSSIDNEVALFSGTTGKLIKSAGATFDKLAREDESNTFKSPQTIQGASAPANPSVVGTSSIARVTGSTTTSLTFAHTSTGHPLIVCTGHNTGVPSVTYAGIPMTSIGSGAGALMEIEWFLLLSPPAGTANVIVSMTASTFITALARNIANYVSASAPVTVGGSGTTTPSVTISSAVGALVIDWIVSDSANQVFTEGAQQTLDAALQNVSNVKGAGSHEAGATSVVMSWTLSVTDQMTLSAISLATSAAPPINPKLLLNDPSLAAGSNQATIGLNNAGNVAINQVDSGGVEVTTATFERDGDLVITGTLSAKLAETYATINAEASLPNSRRLVSGSNITFDTSIAGQLVINSTGGDTNLNHVSGPASAINDDLTIFDGTTGKLIKDSGIPSTGIALKYASNIFTGSSQTLSTGQPTLNFIETTQVAGLRVFQIYGFGQELRIAAADDSFTGTATVLRAKRNGDVILEKNLEVQRTATVGSRLTITNQWTGDIASRIRLTDITKPTNTRTWEIASYNNDLYFWPINDDTNQAQAQVLKLYRSGSVEINGSTSIFTQPGAADASLWLTNTVVAAGLRSFRLMSYDGAFQIWNESNVRLFVLDSIGNESITGTFTSNLIKVNGYGTDVTAAGGIACTHLEAAPYHIRAGTGLYDYNRNAPIGQWIKYTSSWMPGSGTVSIGTLFGQAYMLVGKTIWISVYANSVTLTGVGNMFYVAIPAGLVLENTGSIMNAAAAPLVYYEGGVSKVGMAQYYYSQYGQVSLYRNQHADANWGTTTISLFFQIAIPIV